MNQDNKIYIHKLLKSLEDKKITLEYVLEKAHKNLSETSKISYLQNINFLFTFSIAHGYGTAIRMFLEKYPNIINAIDSRSGNFVLNFAIKYGQTEAFKILLDKGANIEHTNQYGGTVLMHAAQEGYVEIVTALLERGANIDHTDQYGRTALAIAAYHGQTETVEILLQHNANIEHTDQYGCTALTMAAQNGHTEAVEILLQQGANINHVAENGATALITAAVNGHAETVKILLEHGAQIERTTYIHSRHEFAHLNLAENFIERLNIANGTALIYASKNGHTETVKILLEHGARIEHTACINHGGEPALLHLTENVTEVLSIGGGTALIYASKNGHTETVKILLEYGAKIEHTTNISLTALLLAALNGHTEAVKILLEHGANIEHTHHRGRTALMFAIENRYADICHADVIKTLKDASLLKRFINDAVGKFANLLSPREQMQISNDGLALTKLNCFKTLFDRMPAILSCFHSAMEKKKLVDNFAKELLKLDGPIQQTTFDHFIMNNNPAFLVGLGAHQSLDGVNLPNELINKIGGYLPGGLGNTAFNLFKSGLEVGESRVTNTTEQAEHSNNTPVPTTDDNEKTPAVASSSTAAPERKRERANEDTMTNEPTKRQRGSGNRRPNL